MIAQWVLPVLGRTQEGEHVPPGRPSALEYEDRLLILLCYAKTDATKLK